VRFVDFLRATVLLSAGTATLLATITLIGATRENDPSVVYIAAGWWAAAAMIGVFLGRRAEATSPIARLLADAHAQTTLPEMRPGLTILNRLWPLLLCTFAAGILGLLMPQVSAVAAGFGIIWALAWRRQDSAVAAIEERDAARFYVDKTSPHRPMQLVRTPGFGGQFLPS
jgi:hypothetical protein